MKNIMNTLLREKTKQGKNKTKTKKQTKKQQRKKSYCCCFFVIIAAKFNCTGYIVYYRSTARYYPEGLQSTSTLTHTHMTVMGARLDHSTTSLVKMIINRCLCVGALILKLM